MSIGLQAPTLHIPFPTEWGKARCAEGPFVPMKSGLRINSALAGGLGVSSRPVLSLPKDAIFPPFLARKGARGMVELLARTF